jgi:hypothetical protein
VMTDLWSMSRFAGVDSHLQVGAGQEGMTEICGCGEGFGVRKNLVLLLK